MVGPQPPARSWASAEADGGLLLMATDSIGLSGQTLERLATPAGARQVLSSASSQGRVGFGGNLLWPAQSPRQGFLLPLQWRCALTLFMFHQISPGLDG